jgi:hypothetical protein
MQGRGVWGPTVDTEDLCGDTTEGTFTWVQTLDDVELMQPIKILSLISFGTLLRLVIPDTHQHSPDASSFIYI